MSPSALPAFVDQVPDYSVRNGQMHIGMGGLGLVMPINVFLTGCQLGKAAIAEWERSHRDAEVIRFEPQTKFERVYRPKNAS